METTRYLIPPAGHEMVTILRQILRHIAIIHQASACRIQPANSWSNGSERGEGTGRTGAFVEFGRTDRAGFEPAVPLTRYAGLANRCLQPLGHLSRGGGL